MIRQTFCLSAPQGRQGQIQLTDVGFTCARLLNIAMADQIKYSPIGTVTISFHIRRVISHFGTV